MSQFLSDEELSLCQATWKSTDLMKIAGVDLHFSKEQRREACGKLIVDTDNYEHRQLHGEKIDEVYNLGLKIYAILVDKWDEYCRSRNAPNSTPPANPLPHPPAPTAVANQPSPRRPSPVVAAANPPKVSFMFKPPQPQSVTTVESSVLLKEALNSKAVLEEEVERLQREKLTLATKIRDMEERDREVSYVEAQAERIMQDRNNLDRQNFAMKAQIASLKKECEELRALKDENGRLRFMIAGLGVDPQTGRHNIRIEQPWVPQLLLTMETEEEVDAEVARLREMLEGLGVNPDTGEHHIVAGEGRGPKQKLDITDAGYNETVLHKYREERKKWANNGDERLVADIVTIMHPFYPRGPDAPHYIHQSRVQKEAGQRILDQRAGGNGVGGDAGGSNQQNGEAMEEEEVDERREGMEEPIAAAATSSTKARAGKRKSTAKKVPEKVPKKAAKKGRQ